MPQALHLRTAQRSQDRRRLAGLAGMQRLRCLPKHGIAGYARCTAHSHAAHQSPVLLKAIGCASARKASSVQEPGPASASALSPAEAQGRGMVAYGLPAPSCMEACGKLGSATAAAALPPSLTQQCRWRGQSTAAASLPDQAGNFSSN